MKLAIAILSNLLFATTITAFAVAPEIARRSQQQERRAILEPPTKVKGRAVAASSTNAIWSGAVMTAAPAGTSFSAVSGTFVVPKPSPPTSGPGSWGGSAWVGIDGYYSNPYALLQAGVSWEVDVSSTGATTYTYLAWYEWAALGGGQVNLPMTIHAGDTVYVTCQVKTDTSGYCTVFDKTTGQELTTDIYPPRPPPDAPPSILNGSSVEWIVEDWQQGDGSSIPFANFHQVTFTEAQAIASNSTTGAYNVLHPNAGNSVVEVIVQNGQVLTSTSFPGTNQVQVTYV